MASSTRLLSTEELFEGFNELYGSAESEGEAAGSGPVSSTTAVAPDVSSDMHSAHLEITESGEAFSVRAELPSFDSAESPASSAAVSEAAPGSAAGITRKARKRANPVLRAIDLLADADRENITATLRGGMLEVKLPKGRVESLAAARSALFGSAAGSRPRGG